MLFQNIARSFLHFVYVFHKTLDCASDTAAAEMRAAYKVGFKDGVTMMQAIQADQSENLAKKMAQISRLYAHIL